MKIILSPSKTQNITISKNIASKNNIIFSNLTIPLFENLQALTKEELSKTLKIKGKLLEDTYKLYQKFDITNKKLQAIDCYSGVVFEQIKANTYNHEQLNYLNKSFVILSAMYGVLEPNTLIWPYRLDMTNKLKNIKLYDYWQEAVNNYFEDTDYIINLASNEFSKLLKYQQHKLINIHFLEKHDNKFKIISYNAKKARGKMANKIIKKQITNLDQLKVLPIDDYLFNKFKSTNKDFYFIKYD
ncbi:MAG: YaaA family protein [Bacillota bacterium]